MNPSRMTISGLMIGVAVVGLVLGLAANFRWFLPLVFLLLLTAPQTIIVAACMYMATREKK